jgi:hypothetical protein
MSDSLLFMQFWNFFPVDKKCCMKPSIQQPRVTIKVEDNTKYTVKWPIQMKKNRSSWKNSSTTFLLYDTDRMWKDVCNNYFIVACIFLVALSSLRSRCLSTVIVYTYRHTGWWEGFMKYAVQMSSGAMIYVHTKFYKDWFKYSKSNRKRVFRHTAWWSHKPILIFSK